MYVRESRMGKKKNVGVGVGVECLKHLLLLPLCIFVRFDLLLETCCWVIFWLRRAWTPSRILWPGPFCLSHHWTKQVYDSPCRPLIGCLSCPSAHLFYFFSNPPGRISWKLLAFGFFGEVTKRHLEAVPLASEAQLWMISLWLKREVTSAL